MAAPNIPSLGSVIIIGGCGMVGHHIVSLLHQRHPESQISVLDIRTNRNRHASPSIQYFDGDITSRDSVLQVFQAVRPDVVIHTASPTLMGGSKAVFEKVNVGGTRCLLEVSVEVGVKAFVYTSSASVVSDNVSDLINADERWPYVPRALQSEIYAVTKVKVPQAFFGFFLFGLQRLEVHVGSTWQGANFMWICRWTLSYLSWPPIAVRAVC
jgi:sterol-4alpha-carboxylate 3-dehydrogenase (decarboxylating)